MNRRDKNLDLARRIREGDTDARAEMIKLNMRLVSSIINKKYKSLPKLAQYKDVQQSGFLGLIEAVDKFDPEKGTSFSEFAYFHILRHIMLCVWRSENSVYVPYNVAFKSVENSDEAVGQFVLKARQVNKDVVPLVNSIDHHYEEENIDRLEQIEWIRSCINKLPDRERSVINLVYQKDNILQRKDVANKLGMTVNHVNHVMKCAYIRLREMVV